MMIPMPVPVESTSLHDRVQRLESALVLSLETLQKVVELLENRFGKDFFGDDLKQLTASGTDVELNELLDAIETSLASGKQPAAVRQIREAFNCTWDQAHQALSKWAIHSRAEKLRWLRLSRYIKAIEPSNPK